MKNLLIAVLYTTIFVVFLFTVTLAVPASALSKEPPQISTVKITGRCLGTGSVVKSPSGKRLLISAAHVCACAENKGKVLASFSDGTTSSVRIIKKDWSADLCAGAVSKNITALSIANKVSYMEEVNTFSYPHGAYMESHGQVLDDMTWSHDFSIEEVKKCPVTPKSKVCRLTFTSTLTNLFGEPGSSGSPVMDDKGDMVGVITSWYGDNSFSAGMVPLDQLKIFLEGL